MTYIFDLLHQKHYFEVLMRKKLDPVGVGRELGSAFLSDDLSQDGARRSAGRGKQILS